MRRRVVLIIVFLLLGAIVNVAVAWGCAIRCQQAEWARTQAMHRWDADVRKDGSALSPIDEQLLHRLGYRLPPPSEHFFYVNTVVVDSHALYTRRSYFEFRKVQPTAPTGSRNMQIIAPFADQTAVGWPMRCGFNRRLPEDWSKLLWNKKHTHAFRVSFGQSEYWFPVGVLWPGFGINTLFYAAILWLLFIAPFIIQRKVRHRRGQCEKCAYPIGVSPVCTECGAPVTRPGELAA